jgi:F-type H+-transporting ATPase subunit b
MNLVTPDLGLIFWMTLSFLLLVFILKKFAWKPILNMLHEREKSIDEAIHAADIARQDMEKLKFNNEQLLREAKTERDEILREARNVKEAIIEEAKIKANDEADRIVQAAKESIHFEKMAAITDLKNQIATLSIEIASEILKEELSASGKHDEMVKQMLNKVNFN